MYILFFILTEEQQLCKTFFPISTGCHIKALFDNNLFHGFCFYLLFSVNLIIPGVKNHPFELHMFIHRQ